MSALLSVLYSPVIFTAAAVLALIAAAVAGWLGAHVPRLRAQLAEARQEADGLAAHRDSVIAELALTRARLAEARQAAGRARAMAEELRARLAPTIKIEREFGESRCEAANRVIRNALGDRHQ
ncbi:hypothetical protein [Caulobacter segnis]|uniref:hypothetical protein n=1 Tax=Caulobacter segnis TaxID=88688 RepID=UPI00285C8E94|nr:hypothetical protein [Caulobacter segnis]MDR6624296.1 NAD/NADP transhydrogenase alpha subunit [Caulobacter segnis]